MSYSIRRQVSGYTAVPINSLPRNWNIERIAIAVLYARCNFRKQVAGIASKQCTASPDMGLLSTSIIASAVCAKEYYNTSVNLYDILSTFSPYGVLICYPVWNSWNYKQLWNQNTTLSQVIHALLLIRAMKLLIVAPTQDPNFLRLKPSSGRLGAILKIWRQSVYPFSSF